MRMFMRVGIPVVLCLLVLGASQVMAEQCSICNRSITVPVSYASPSPSCHASCGSCAASCSVTKVIAVPVVPCGIVQPCATPCPAPCPNPCPKNCNTCPSPCANSCNTCPASSNRSVFDQLRFENRQQRDLYAKIRCAPLCALPDLYSQFRANVVSHIKGLQGTLYAQTMNAQCCDPCTANWIRLSAEQQQMVLTQICALDQTAPCDPMWKVRFDNLADIIARSWFIEQDKAYGAIAKCIGPEACSNFCTAYNGAKAEALAALPQYQMLSTTAFVPGACFGSGPMNTSMSNDDNK